jgi:hypothetical protein
VSAMIGKNDQTTIHVPALNAITLTIAGAGSVIRLSDAPGGEPYSPVALVTGTQVVGPFAGPTRHRLECSLGTVAWAISPSDFPAVTSDVERIIKLSQAEYDALSPADPVTLYLIVG